MAYCFSDYFLFSKCLERKKVKSLSRVRFFATPWIVAYQAPPSMGFSRQEYWSGLPFPFPEDLPDPGIKPSAVQSLSHVQLFASPWTAAHQASLSLTNSWSVQILTIIYPLLRLLHAHPTPLK